MNIFVFAETQRFQIAFDTFETLAGEVFVMLARALGICSHKLQGPIRRFAQPAGRKRR